MKKKFYEYVQKYFTRMSVKDLLSQLQLYRAYQYSAKNWTKFLEVPAVVILHLFVKTKNEPANVLTKSSRIQPTISQQIYRLLYKTFLICLLNLCTWGIHVYQKLQILGLTCFLLLVPIYCYEINLFNLSESPFILKQNLYPNSTQLLQHYGLPEIIQQGLTSYCLPIGAITFTILLFVGSLWTMEGFNVSSTSFFESTFILLSKIYLKDFTRTSQEENLESVSLIEREYQTSLSGIIFFSFYLIWLNGIGIVQYHPRSGFFYQRDNRILEYPNFMTHYTDFQWFPPLEYLINAFFRVYKKIEALYEPFFDFFLLKQKVPKLLGRKTFADSKRHVHIPTLVENSNHNMLLDNNILCHHLKKVNETSTEVFEFYTVPRAFFFQFYDYYVHGVIFSLSRYYLHYYYHGLWVFFFALIILFCGIFVLYPYQLYLTKLQFDKFSFNYYRPFLDQYFYLWNRLLLQFPAYRQHFLTQDQFFSQYLDYLSFFPITATETTVAENFFERLFNKPFLLNPLTKWYQSLKNLLPIGEPYVESEGDDITKANEDNYLYTQRFSSRKFLINSFLGFFLLLNLVQKEPWLTIPLAYDSTYQFVLDKLYVWLNAMKVYETQTPFQLTPLIFLPQSNDLPWLFQHLHHHHLTWLLHWPGWFLVNVIREKTLGKVQYSTTQLSEKFSTRLSVKQQQQQTFIKLLSDKFKQIPNLPPRPKTVEEQKRDAQIPLTPEEQNFLLQLAENKERLLKLFKTVKRKLKNQSFYQKGKMFQKKD